MALPRSHALLGYSTRLPPERPPSSSRSHFSSPPPSGFRLLLGLIVGLLSSPHPLWRQRRRTTAATVGSNKALPSTARRTCCRALRPGGFACRSFCSRAAPMVPHLFPTPSRGSVIGGYAFVKGLFFTSEAPHPTTVSQIPVCMFFFVVLLPTVSR